VDIILNGISRGGPSCHIGSLTLGDDFLLGTFLDHLLERDLAYVIFKEVHPKELFSRLVLNSFLDGTSYQILSIYTKRGPQLALEGDLKKINLCIVLEGGIRDECSGGHSPLVRCDSFIVRVHWVIFSPKGIRNRL
jgi:hypothetical protein